MFCMQEYSGRRVVKHNFRYRVHPCSMSIIYPLLCFLNVIYAPSCNRCVLITPVPGARSPCTSPSAWGSFPDSIEPRGMHHRGARPLSPFPLVDATQRRHGRCLRAKCGRTRACSACSALVPVPAHAIPRRLGTPQPLTLPPARTRPRSPAAHPDRPHVFSPARPPVVSHACPPARLPMLSPSLALSLPLVPRSLPLSAMS